MHELIKNLRHKEYNPCGSLTGRERGLCDEAVKKFPNLPFVEVMRIISVKAIAELQYEKTFPNVDALKHWADYNLNNIERRAHLDFDTFTPLQAGLAKYLVHVVYENRYNIHYNVLIDYCRKFDAKTLDAAVERGLTVDALEQEINFLAQEADYSATHYVLNEKLKSFILGAEGNGDIVDAVLDVFATFD